MRGASCTAGGSKPQKAGASGWGGNPKALHPLGVGPRGAPGANANAVARESHIDTMAAKAGADPVEFRLNNLKEARIRRVLQAAVKFTKEPAPSD